VTEYLRVSGVYWGLTAMSLMNRLHTMKEDEVLEFIKTCQHPSGGFGASENHDAHLLYTLSSIQVRLYQLLICSTSYQHRVYPVGKIAEKQSVLSVSVFLTT